MLTVTSGVEMTELKSYKLILYTLSHVLRVFVCCRIQESPEAFPTVTHLVRCRKVEQWTILCLSSNLPVSSV